MHCWKATAMSAAMPSARSCGRCSASPVRSPPRAATKEGPTTVPNTPSAWKASASASRSDIAAIYRAQSQGKVKITTVPSPHEGLGVSYYAWSSSPLRRYVDLVNQWQLASLLNGTAPPYQRNSASLLGAIRDFEQSYMAYGEFQDRMERYWCLRWLLQENVRQTHATVVRDNSVKFRDLPLYVRVPSLPPDVTPGTQVIVEVAAVDLIDSTIDAIYKSRLSGSTGE